VLFEFMQFRRGYDADYLDFNVERTLSNWKSAAVDLGTPEDFFSTDLSDAYKKAVETQGQPEVEPSPGETKPMPNEPKVESNEPKVESSGAPGQAVLQVPSGNRPPTLDNPGL
jgi:hypothetical protein